MKYKSIRIYESTFEGLNKLCVKYDCSKTELSEAMSAYFLKTGIDPNDPTDVTSEVKKLKNQLISFIRTQEQDKLNPLIKKQDLLIDRFINHLKEEVVTRKYMEKLAQVIIDKLRQD